MIFLTAAKLIAIIPIKVLLTKTSMIAIFSIKDSLEWGNMCGCFSGDILYNGLYDNKILDNRN